MSCVEYNTPVSTTQGISLEDEILVLRNEMLQTFMQEQSLTSELVIEISCKLDLKINEYMKLYGVNYKS